MTIVRHTCPHCKQTADYYTNADSQRPLWNRKCRHCGKVLGGIPKGLIIKKRPIYIIRQKGVDNMDVRHIEKTDLETKNICLFCGAETKNPKYCSHSCRAKHVSQNPEWQKKHGNAMKRKWRTKSSLQKRCPICKRIVHSGRKYCSKKCRSLASHSQPSTSKWKVMEHLKTLLSKKCPKCGNDCDITVWMGSDNNKHRSISYLCPNCGPLSDI